MTPKNEALCNADPLDKLRQALQRDFTPSTQDIAEVIRWTMHDIVMAEEYKHPVISREEALKRAKDMMELAMAALRQATIYQIKEIRGEWVAVA